MLDGMTIKPDKWNQCLVGVLPLTLQIEGINEEVEQTLTVTVLRGPNELSNLEAEAKRYLLGPCPKYGRRIIGYKLRKESE